MKKIEPIFFLHSFESENPRRRSDGNKMAAEGNKMALAGNSEFKMADRNSSMSSQEADDEIASLGELKDYLCETTLNVSFTKF